MTLRLNYRWAFVVVVGSFSLFLSGCMGSAQMSHSGHGKMQNHSQRERAKVNWVDFEEGQRRARAEGKLMVVDFYVSEGCHRCMVMDENVYSQAAIADKINNDFIPVRVDLEGRLPPGAKAIGKRYDFKFDCLLVVCDADGNAVKDSSSGRMCFTEAVKPEWFISYLNKAAGLNGSEDFFADMED